MTTQPLPHASPGDIRSIDAGRIPPLTHVEAGTLARVELSRFLTLIETVGADDWDRPTFCTGWSVRDIVAHQAGAYAGFTSRARFFHQWLPKQQPGQQKIDAVNAFQIAERADRTPAELIEELRVAGPQAITNRQRLLPLIRALPLPIPPIGLRTFGYLTDTLYLRDTWIHRVDISHAVGHPLELTPEHDGRITALIVGDLAPGLARHLGGALIVYDLHGQAGGCFRIGQATAPTATITMDTIDFHLLASGRVSPESTRTRSQIRGDGVLAMQALQHSSVVY